MNKIDFRANTQLWLDRLACGELDEQTRKSLFTWLDAEPLRWRGCALALLEMQTWNESLENIDKNPACVPEPAFRAIHERNRESKILRWRPLSSLAAALLVAFTLGTLSGGWWKSNGEVVANKRPQESEPAGPLMATVSLRPELGSAMPATLQIPVMSVKDSGAHSPSRSISEYDRQKWERRGYQLTKERRFLPAQLPDGKKVVVPVEQVKANYVGSKVS
jgi:hypothetical protein